MILREGKEFSADAGPMPAAVAFSVWMRVDQDTA